MLVNMHNMLNKAKEEKYAVGFFNAVNIEMARAIIEKAEELNAPVIVGTAEILLSTMDLRRVASYLIPLAKDATVPVCIHYDHGLTFEKCIEAIELGFTSIMYDCSTAPYEENIKNVAEMVKICHAKNITVEAELGHVGDNSSIDNTTDLSSYFTDPDTAVDFVKRTGVDALAVAVGNAHGDYKFPPKLDFERIDTISKKTGIPLVLHGGSGLSDSDFKTAASLGICKVNIFTDIDKAGKAGLEEGIKAGEKAMTGLIPYEINAIKTVVENKIRLFGSNEKA